MTDRFLSFIPFVLKWEGSAFENDPDDPGGATKYGIDQRSHPDVDIRSLTEAQAKQIYFAEYWQRSSCEALPPKVGEVVMDISVNNGVRRAGKWLQEAVGAVPDGYIGVKTLALAETCNRDWLVDNLLSRRDRFYVSIAKGRMSKFLKGWLNRNNDLRRWLNV